MPIVPFPRFRPDQSRFSPEASSVITNAKPTKDGWGPLKSLVGISDALPTAPRGATAVKTDAGVWKIFAGTATNLYRIDSTDYSWAEISRTTDGYSLAADIFWRYARYGNFLIATAPGSTYPQFTDLATSNDFANLTNATFSAALVAVVGDFLVFGQIDGDKRKLKWSGVNDSTYWTKAQHGSDEQIFPDGGAIMAIIPQAQNAIIVQETCIRQMIFDPISGFVFRFVVVDPERGATASRSVVNIGPNDFIYLAATGFIRGLEARPIGAERVDRTFFELCSSDKIELVSATADPFEKVVWFRAEAIGGTNFIYGYDWQLDEWFPSSNNAIELLTAATTGYTLEQLDGFGNMDTLPYPLDSPFWQGGVVGFAGFTSDYKFGFFDGETLEATLETEDKQLLYPRRSVTNRVMILADTDDATVAIASKETQMGTLNFGADLSRQSSQPFINSRVGGRFHRFKVKIPAGAAWKNAVGIDVSASDGGAR